MALLALAVLALLAGVNNAANTVCPEQPPCSSDPCTNATCPLYEHAVCVANNCGENCRAAFFHKHHSDHEITSMCTHTSCSQLACNKNQICIEEMVPVVCHHAGCVRHVRARCVSVPSKLPPSNCKYLDCSNGTICRVVHSKYGKIAQCMGARPQSCGEMDFCDEGMVCKMRHGKHPHCVAESTVASPRDCSQLKCHHGFKCAVFGKKNVRARCVKELADDPKSCVELDCHLLNMTCYQGFKHHPVCSSSTPKHCPCKKGHCVLKNYADRNIVSVECDKDSAVTCSSCTTNETCIQSKQGSQKIFHCVQTGCSLNDTSCDSPSDTCIEISGSNNTACVPNTGSFVEGTNCSTRSCVAHRGSLTTCQELSVNNYTIGSSCVSIRVVSCEGLTCSKRRECVEKIQNDQVLSARCEKSAIVEKTLKIS